MGRRIKIGIGALAAALVLIQIIPVDHTNPPVETTIDASEQVMPILRRACFDCHSNETRWPWYSYVAPISWLVRYDVNEGREELNFSTWQRYDAVKRKKMLTKSWEEVKEGEMPPAIYLLQHPDAKLTDADKSLIQSWSRQ